MDVGAEVASGRIYVVDQAGSLTRMQPSAPATEDRMQHLVAQYPELIGDGDGDLLLIRREQPVADATDAAGRWSLDHLFVTRKAVPVLVELKRAVDTRLRREVVGQLLDYAANGVAYWQAGQIAEAFRETCEAAGQSADRVLGDFLGEAESSGFWEQVDANLQAGRIKLVFVADVIPRELARIVEFLNDQMKADVRAVELKWYSADDGMTTLVPRIIGETALSAAKKTTADLSPISTDEWINRYIGPRGENAVAGAHAFLAIVEDLGGEAGITTTHGSLYALFQGADGKSLYPLHLWKDDGRVTLSFKWVVKRPALTDAARQEIYAAFKNVVGPMNTSNLAGFPGFPLDVLADPGVAAQVRELARRYVTLAQRTEA